ncbi:hypothetical protein ANCCAN_23055 [Ancylostoma caninum]|uniref:Uncharacterized protein n=1 Tax=Ancylostoma caninum TaxID=29170 RepID=A0A368FG14_ANCCA|nr:hypothetical protein ANCCAN_23055 [Ancylostoma caninum]
MRILHNNGFTEDEMTQQKRVVYNNTVTAIHQLIKAMQQYQIKYSSPDREVDAMVVQDVIKQGRESEPFTPELAVAIKVLRRNYEWISLRAYTGAILRYILDDPHLQNMLTWFLGQERLFEHERNYST